MNTKLKIVDKKIFKESISESISSLLIFITLILSSYLNDKNSLIIGMSFFLYNFIYFLPLSYEFSSRNQFINYKKSNDNLKKFVSNYKVNMITIYLVLSFILLISIFIMSNSYFESLNIDIKLDQIILALKINFLYTIFMTIFSAFFPRTGKLAILEGESNNVFKLSLRSLFFAILLVSCLYSYSIYILLTVFLIYEVIRDIFIYRLFIRKF